ncbi:hypothetical protein COOONC_14542 [Cooperia oncophora]
MGSWSVLNYVVLRSKSISTFVDSIHSIVLVLACFVRIWSINVVALYLPSAIIERVFASKYVTDYEKFPRPMIYRMIISFLYIISAIIAFFDMLDTDAIVHNVGNMYADRVRIFHASYKYIISLFTVESNVSCAHERLRCNMQEHILRWHTVIVWVFTVAVGGFCLQCLLPFDTKIGMIHGDRATNDHRGASDAYFKQLSTKWEMHAMPRMRSQEEKYVYN